MGERMITVKVIKEGYGHKPGHVLKLTEFEAGHLTAFGYAVPYVEQKIETQMVSAPEKRIEPEKAKIIEPAKPAETVGYFKRAYRRKLK